MLLLTAVVAGCGVKTPAELPVRTLEDGRLSIDPAPITLDHLASQPPRSPLGALLHLWFAIQWWDEPAILGTYAPVVEEAVGPAFVLGAWDLRRAEMIGARPSNVETAREGARAVVTFTRESRTALPSRESASMVLERGRWGILHDTMLEDALAAYAQSRGAGGPRSAAAVRRGVEASRRFRDLAATGSRPRR